jgi:hypothetical protein
LSALLAASMRAREAAHMVRRPALARKIAKRRKGKNAGGA